MEDTPEIDFIIQRGNKMKRKAGNQSAYHARIRLRVIAFLGGKCKHEGCDERDPRNLEIHHTHPHLLGGYKCRPGNDKLQFWRNILAGTEEGELYCGEHHISDAHNGNTSELKKRGV